MRYVICNDKTADIQIYIIAMNYSTTHYSYHSFALSPVDRRRFVQLCVCVCVLFPPIDAPHKHTHTRFVFALIKAPAYMRDATSHTCVRWLLCSRTTQTVQPHTRIYNYAFWYRAQSAFCCVCVEPIVWDVCSMGYYCMSAQTRGWLARAQHQCCSSTKKGMDALRWQTAAPSREICCWSPASQQRCSWIAKNAKMILNRALWRKRKCCDQRLSHAWCEERGIFCMYVCVAAESNYIYEYIKMNLTCW